MLTSAIRPTLMVVAVSPMSVPGEADPAGEAAWVAADDAGAVDAGVLLLLLLEELQPAARRTAAMAATPARRRVRARSGRLRPGLSLLAVTVVPSTTSLPVSLDPADTRSFTTRDKCVPGGQ